jgi:flagellar protein FlaG
MDFTLERANMDAIKVGNASQSEVNQSGNLVEKNIKSASTVDVSIVSKAIESSKFVPSDIAKAAQPTKEVVEKAAQRLQDFVTSMGRSLSFSVDQTTGYHVVKVVNPATGEMIRQLPSEELLKIAQNMDNLKNVLVSQKA